MNSGDSFYVSYQFSAKNQAEAEKDAENIAVEQTAELPIAVIPKKLGSYVGIVTKLAQLNHDRWQTSILFKKELVSGDSIQLLNVIFGNVSIKPGIKIVDLDREYLAEILPGPSLGTEDIRSLLSVYDRPLSCTALKPVGSNTSELAKLAGEFTAGGIDLIKDDHGLVNQPMADFEPRVKHCIQAIRNGEQESGKKTLYFPNITGSAEEIIKRAVIARDYGADGVLIAPQLSGLNCLKELAQRFPELPVMAHPSFSGPFTIHPNSGFDPSIYFGVLWRAMGAGCIIYPNAGGRFSYTRKQCHDINKECQNTALNLHTAFPVPAGGIDRNSLSTWIKQYGMDTIFLIGGSLYKHPDGYKAAASEFQQTLSNHE